MQKYTIKANAFSASIQNYKFEKEKYPNSEKDKTFSYQYMSLLKK